MSVKIALALPHRHHIVHVGDHNPCVRVVLDGEMERVMRTAKFAMDGSYGAPSATPRIAAFHRIHHTTIDNIPVYVCTERLVSEVTPLGELVTRVADPVLHSS